MDSYIGLVLNIVLCFDTFHLVTLNQGTLYVVPTQ